MNSGNPVLDKQDATQGNGYAGEGVGGDFTDTMSEPSMIEKRSPPAPVDRGEGNGQQGSHPKPEHSRRNQIQILFCVRRTERRQKCGSDPNGSKSDRNIAQLQLVP